MTLPQMLADLPRHCDVGTKRNAKGHSESWVGYKLHIDSADGDIPLNCVLTSASLHDSQVAIPLATMTAARVTNLYDLMDAAYDDAAIRQRRAGVHPRVGRGGFYPLARAATTVIARADAPTVPVTIARLLGRPGPLNTGQAFALSTVLMVLTASAVLLVDRWRPRPGARGSWV